MTDFFGGFDILYDFPRIENLDLSVSGHRTAAVTVCASVHHHHTVSGGQEKFGIWEHHRAIVRSTVQEKNPIAVWMGWLELPTTEKDAIVGANDEVFTGRVKALKSLIGSGYLSHSQPTAEGVQNGGSKNQTS